MSTVLTKDNILSAIVSEKSGFHIGHAIRITESSLYFPIFRTSTWERQYVTSTKQPVAFTVNGLRERVLVVNDSDSVVYLRCGTMVSNIDGAGVIARSAVIFPHKETLLRVVPIRGAVASGESCEFCGFLPLSSASQFYGKGFRPAERARIENVNLGYISAGFLEQVGIAYVSDKTCLMVEAFDSADSWQELGSMMVEVFDAVESWNELGSMVQASIDMRPSQKRRATTEAEAENLLHEVLGADYAPNEIFEHRAEKGEAAVKITGLTSGSYVGEVVEIDERFAHLLLIKRGN